MRGQRGVAGASHDATVAKAGALELDDIRRVTSWLCEEEYRA